MTEALTIGNLTFEVRRSAKRRTVEIVVDRGGELRLMAPEGLDQPVLEGFVREKRFWVYTKLAEKEVLQQPVRSKEFVTGESFHYLGRSYRLLLVERGDQPLKLETGRFKLLRPEQPRGRDHFVRWYAEHAGTWLRQRLQRWSPRIGVEPSSVEVRDLGFRWGSCGRSGRLYFHWATILLPPSIVDYVIVHELAHLVEPHHTSEFWLQVERVIPDYCARKLWLAERGAATHVTAILRG